MYITVNWLITKYTTYCKMSTNLNTSNRIATTYYNTVGTTWIVTLVRQLGGLILHVRSIPIQTKDKLEGVEVAGWAPDLNSYAEFNAQFVWTVVKLFISFIKSMFYTLQKCISMSSAHIISINRGPIVFIFWRLE